MTQQSSDATTVITSHPLDGCDPLDLHRTMMDERRDLIKSWKDSEDGFVKTNIQVTTALVSLSAGFLSQYSIVIPRYLIVFIGLYFSFCVISLFLSMCELLFSSKAHRDQQILLEKYYSKQISEFGEPWANKAVRACQYGILFTFTCAIVLLACFAVFQAQERTNERTKEAQPAAATANASSEGRLRK